MLDQSNNLNCYLLSDISYLYLFHLIVLLNPVFNCSKRLLSFSADKVTTGTCNLKPVIVYVAFVGATITGISGTFSCAGTAACVIISVKTQFLEQVKVKYTSKLINGICNVLQRLLRWFNVARSTSLVPLLTAVCTAFVFR